MKYYIILIFSVLVFSSCSENKAADTNAVANKPVTPQYQLAVVKKAGVTTILKLPAQLAAYQEVSIFPKVNGYVKTVLVDIGSKVSKGTLLMVLEAPELEQASLEAKEKYERAKADYSIDQEHYQRLVEASKTPGAISPLDLSTIKAKMEADNALCSAENANWQMQQTMMGYLKVTAPFSGVITERNVHPGALVSAEEKTIPMLELKQVDLLRLQVDIPEGIAGTLNDKDSIAFYTSAFPGKKMIGVISRKSDNINEQYRSERMEIDVVNKDGSLAPGMYADIVLQSKGNNNGLSVPKSSVVTSTERKYVLVMKKGKITKIDVSTGNETLDNIEVYGQLQSGDSVITNANDEISETAQ
ncbi:MAG TPA: efflux RND transporter periplasmic adaptor subunit [Ferruginibacter sp.]|jgi:membrane fusion protein (multidrug efflux system)|nr:efflux RND transporter periplasmic adaptor subunit [Ferruginibacter sp.]